MDFTVSKSAMIQMALGTGFLLMLTLAGFAMLGKVAVAACPTCAMSRPCWIISEGQRKSACHNCEYQSIKAMLTP